MMMVALPSGLRRASPRSRATLSVGPPAANGTTIVIGLSGYSANAVDTTRAARAANSVRFMARSLGWSARPLSAATFAGCLRKLRKPGKALIQRKESVVATRVLDHLAVVRQRARRRQHHVAGARPHDLHDHLLVDHQAFARLGLVGHEAEVGRGVALVAGDAACGEPVAQGRRERLAAHERLAHRRKWHAEVFRLVEKHL